ncbi:hypothetical protein [Haloquadratum walsbyi]|jgi:hypothetical protein|uniref:Uncharacterized protein n=1 Tax=Haloquadratum walsbyi J07HQW2 TaxID=1238425 RepID=U1MUZ8_9EURY|nr:hypothetical protein [Haloquadratum walsbyi]ERG94224.1 MAG: hypothetical protein J07HQW2_00658 [Haloquadratum walsbyi J07HQW2]
MDAIDGITTIDDIDNPDLRLLIADRRNSDVSKIDKEIESIKDHFDVDEIFVKACGSD